VVKGNKEARQWEHMANINREQAMCSSTKHMETFKKDRTDKAARAEL